MVGSRYDRHRVRAQGGIASRIGRDGRARARKVRPGRKQDRALGRGFAFVAQLEEQREREAAARGVARDEKWTRSLRPQRAPGAVGVVQRGRKRVFRREAVIGREDAQAALG